MNDFEEFIAGLNPPPKIPEMKKNEELEEMVDAEIVKDIHNLLYVKSEALPISTKHRFGDKIRIIIVK